MEPSDAELMEQIREGDRRAFSQLVNRYKHPLVSYLARLTGDRSWAEDLAQETFVRLYDKAPGYRESGRLAGYLFRMASNLTCSALRRRQRREWLRRVFLPGSNGGPPAPNPEQAAGSREVAARVQRALLDLPLRSRIPLVLHELQGMAYAEVAEACGLAEGTVKSRIARGRAQLRRGLSDMFEGGGA